MKEQREYLSLMDELSAALSISSKNIDIYKNSLCIYEGSIVFMAKIKGDKKLVVYGDNGLYNEIKGENYRQYKVCELNHENRLVVNKYLKFTRPKAFGQDIATMGLGDRLGMVTAAHCKAIKNRKIKPILAQQSIRELNLTGRTYKEVLDDVCFLVLQEGYRGGFGADADHLKLEEDIRNALEAGYTMITLDCSEQLGNAENALEKCQTPSEYVKKHYEKYYLSQTFFIDDSSFAFSRKDLMENIAVYGDAIDFIEVIYIKHMKELAGQVDFEISLDETDKATSILGHLFVAEELKRRGVHITSMAPRFVGEFQKGIDYIGDLKEFEDNFIAHANIADHFGYKLSIHSGSDKFSVFPSIGQHTKGRLHIKTSGTNWLEAVKVIAKANPNLFREMFQHAIIHFEEAREYYYVTTDMQSLRGIENIPDHELELLFADGKIRQLLHITYGFMLKNSVYANRIFETLNDHEELLEATIIRHIGKHLKELGFKK